MTVSGPLAELAKAYGIQLQYSDISGKTQTASAEGVRAVLTSLGVNADNDHTVRASLEHFRAASDFLEPVIVAWEGVFPDLAIPDSIAANARYQLHLEDGSVLSGALGDGPLPRLPLGYHDFAIDNGSYRAHATVLAAPRRAYESPDTRAWGLFLPLYALRTQSNQGIGDFRALADLMRWTAHAGGAYVGTLPLLAGYLDEPFEPSPYSPVSKLFWNEVYVDLNGALELAPSQSARTLLTSPGFAAMVEQLNAAELIDYRAVAACKRKVLEALASAFFDAGLQESTEFKQFLEYYPRIHDYARFRAAVEKTGKTWQEWPERMRDGTLNPGDYDEHSAQFHTFAQYVIHRQLERMQQSADGARLYLDLPIGVNGGGYDVWRDRDLFARGATAGAPPDAFFTQGQDWGFPPLNPITMRQDGYRYLRETIRTHLRYAGALRLDHVMMLHRLFWVPTGAGATAGVYVSYPAEELYAVLCLESSRHQAVIVGEDLGTVPPEVREGMERHHLLRMYVVQFEATADDRDALSPVPEPSVASLNTHDMPPFAAYRTARDAELREELGLLSAEEVEHARAGRQHMIGRLSDQMRRAGFLHEQDGPDLLRDALLRYLAASQSRLVLLTLEDLWDEVRPQNVPGTGPERPNWRRVAQYTLEQLMSSNYVNGALKRINDGRNES